MNRRLGILLVCAGIGALQVWFWLQVLLDPGYLAHSDLYEQFLPNFLSPLTWWSSSEFAGLPVFADPQGAIWYPLHWLFARAGSDCSERKREVSCEPRYGVMTAPVWPGARPYRWASTALSDKRST